MKGKWMKVVGMVLVVGVLAGCGTAGAPTEVSSDRQEQEDTSKHDPELPADESVSQENETGLNEESSVAEIPGFSKAGIIEETVLYDENDIKIAATGIDYTDYKVKLNLMIENNSAKDYSFISGSWGYSCNAVNGYMFDGGYMNTDVAAGKKANEEISFSIDELMVYGITEIADIQIGIEIKDTDYKSVYTGPCRIATNLADGYDRARDTYKETVQSGVLESLSKGRIVYYKDDNAYKIDGLDVISETCLENRDGERIILLEVCNNMEELVYGSISNIKLNGLTVCSSAWTNESIVPGCRRIMSFSVANLLEREYAEQIGMEAIGKVTFDFSVMDAKYEDIRKPVTVDMLVDSENQGTINPGETLYDDAGIKLVSMGLIGDTSKYSDDIHWLIIVENNTNTEINIDDVYDSLSVNGFMTDCIVTSRTVGKGGKGLIDVEILGMYLEKNGIHAVEDIREAEISFEVKNDNWKTIANPKITTLF